MARTSLLRWISRMSRQCRLANRHGLPVAAVMEQAGGTNQGGTRLTRRKFLRATAAAAAGLALPEGSWAAGSRRRQPSIAIIGAGVSGLNCALTLADHGFRSTVYEASGRIGGRMFSNNHGYWSHGQVSEWGGELIDSGHTAIQALANRFRLSLDDLTAAQPTGSEETLFFDGHYYPRAEAVQDFQALYQALQDDSSAADYPTTYNSSTAAGRTLDLMSVWDWIEARVPGGHDSKMGQLLDVAYAIEYGADTSDQSALNLLYLLSGSDQDLEIFGASDERFHVRGGNQQIPLAIAHHLGRLGVPILTGMSLASIRKRPNGSCRLAFESGSGPREVVADLVVLTLPFAVLRTLDYGGAEFDALKQTAIQELGRGHNGKLQLQFTQRLWNEPGAWGISTGTSFADTGFQNTWEPTRAQPGRAGILNNYTGGSVTGQKHAELPFAVVTNHGVQQDAADFLQRISPIFPDLPNLWNGKATSSLPHLSPFFNCSYSYWRVGQYQKFAGYEAVRQGNIFFAGEHTSVNFQGYMEGGAAEGQRAAQEILTQFAII